VTAPAQEIIWLDCDTFPIRALDYLFHVEEYRKTGTLFWGDFCDIFDEESVFQNPNFRTRHANSLIFPRDAWYVKHGFDSGILVVDKMKRQHELSVLEEISIKNASEYAERWSKLSMGDKDLWKIAWIFSGTNYSMIPTIAALGSFDEAGRFMLTSQPKHDPQGNIVALHQLHRGGFTKEGMEKNFGARHWTKLGAPPPFNIPSETIAIDLRNPMDFIGRHGLQWDGLSSELSPLQMYHTSHDLLGHVYSMGQAWDYQLKDHEST
jgi:hypothetical protein